MNSYGYGMICGNDVELIDAVPDGFSAEIRQLATGPLGLHAEWVDLPGVRVQRDCWLAAFSLQEQRVERAFSLAVVVAADDYVRFRGIEVDLNEVLLQPFGVPLEYRYPTNSTALTIQVAPSLAKSLGWPLNQQDAQLFRTSRRSTLTFLSVCEEILGTARTRSDLVVPPSVVQLASRGRLLSSLHRLVKPLTARTPNSSVRVAASREYALVKQAERWYASRQPQDKAAITEIADGLGISMRTLNRAFNTWTGVSPGRYFALLRLHEFRKRLVKSGSDSPVTNAATDTGFDHLGRLAGDYRKLFGETPRETLHRWQPRAGEN